MLGRSAGVLYPQAASGMFQTTWRQPRRDLAPFVQQYWITTWDLRGHPAYLQRVLPSPSVNLTLKRGRSRVAGVSRGQFTELLDDVHRVVGVMFRPGGFRPYLGSSVSAITDRFVPVAEIFGSAGAALEGPVMAARDVAEMVGLVEDFLGSVRVQPDPAVGLVAAVVADIAADAQLVRVAELAGRYGMSVRRLQRLFASYVGVGPKWVIRRYRMQDAAARAARGRNMDWAGLATDLGYTDQAHFSRDFTANVGQSPARYSRACVDGTSAHLEVSETLQERR